jgi:Cu+-exporting ATPase
MQIRKRCKPLTSYYSIIHPRWDDRYTVEGGVLMQKDPICGMMVDEKKTKLTSKHDNKSFYFCSAECKATFDKDAHKHGHV